MGSGVPRLWLTVTVVGTGGDGTSPTLLLTAERQAPYSADRTTLACALFNCGENTRRLCNARHLKLSKLCGVHLTTPAPRGWAGLPSLWLAAADTGVGSLVVTGPAACTDAVVSGVCSCVVRRKFPVVSAVGVPEGATTVDAAVSVTGDDGTAASDGPAIPPAPEQPPPPPTTLPFSVTPLPVQCSESGVQWVCYLVRAVHDVGCAVGAGAAALVVDCPPGPHTVAALTRSPAVAHVVAWGARPWQPPQALVVYHMADPCVVASKPYTAWTRTLPSPACRHEFVACSPLASRHALLHALSARQLACHDVAPKLCPLPFLGGVLPGAPADGGAAACGMPSCVLYPTRPGAAPAADPPAGRSPSGEPCWCTACCATAVPGCASDGAEGVPMPAHMNRAASHALRAHLDAADAGADKPAAPPPALPASLLLHGTGCAAPSPTRGSSAISLCMPCPSLPLRGLLLDCGEGTVGQLVRAYGTAAPTAVLQLAGVWVSHTHLDHVGGLPTLVALHTRLRQSQPLVPPLLVTGSAAVARFLHAAAAASPTGCMQFRWVSGEDMNHAAHPARAAFLAPPPGRAPWPTDVYHILSVRVQHCSGALGIVIWLRSGLQVVFSGDTRPCDALISAGRGAGVLVHEATFGAEHAAHAVAKRHSTVEEAVGVARRMAAHNLVLTHFSQRYPRVPAMDDTASGMPVVTALDGMVVDLTPGGLARAAEACKRLAARAEGDPAAD